MAEGHPIRRFMAALPAVLLGFTVCLAEARAQDSLVAIYDTAKWTVGLLRFDQDSIDHTTATVSCGADSGLIVYCSYETVIALRVDSFYPNGPLSERPDVAVEHPLPGQGRQQDPLRQVPGGPFSFADNSYGGGVTKELANSMKGGSSVQLLDQTIGLDKTFPLRGSAKALSSLGCV